jgi:signal transduction histidine kinase
MTSTNKFRISSALKNIIGKELITNQYIAVFELVKNSYDAGATKVTVEFNQNQIKIIDDGSGMTEEGLINKWLFVAYSDKKDPNSASNRSDQTRSRVFAGSKGIGRFSCDRLGSKLELLTKVANQPLIHKLSVNWSLFEQDPQKEFLNIPIEIDQITKNDIGRQGTILIVSDLRDVWDKKSIVELKKRLAKLIDPAKGKGEDMFEIYVRNNFNRNDSETNGLIVNDIFDKIRHSTTNITVSIDRNGEKIHTTVQDRNEFVFEVVEKNNKFPHLKEITIELYYLSTGAKIIFHKRMGIENVNFGSVFVYKNGFRILPYGDPNTDLFNIDRRKAQGYNRYLGTRDILGQIQIAGDSQNFSETSSRDGGFIESEATLDLKDLFKNKALKPLERYVTHAIDWGRGTNQNDVQIDDKYTEYIVKQFMGEASPYKLILFKLGPKILEYIRKNRPGSIETALNKLEKNTSSLENNELSTSIADIRKQFQKQSSYAQELSNRMQSAEKELQLAHEETKVLEKQNTFLNSAQGVDLKKILRNLHEIFTHSEIIKRGIKHILKKFKPKSLKSVETDLLLTLLSAEMINKYTKLAINNHANFSFKDQKIDVVTLVREYVSRLESQLKITVVETPSTHQIAINGNPIDFYIIIDNVVSNSIKAHASNLTISFTLKNYSLIIKFRDNGHGLNRTISNPKKIFEFGYTTTNGYGIGLNHIKQIVDAHEGTISINETIQKGFELIIEIKK